MKQKLLLILFTFLAVGVYAQQSLRGEVLNEQTREPVPGATISISDSSNSVTADDQGRFSISIPAGLSLRVTATGYETKMIIPDNGVRLIIKLKSLQKELETVVVTGTMKAVRRSESPVTVEVYTPQFLKKNPAPSIFESLQNVNGVRPQLNCSVCNTGDIHINGLEGPYTMITIDGMPIVSSLASVYGLFGIPTQLIDRIEIVKGPASGLYGSEAIGGLINIITKSPDKAPLFTANMMSTNWLEHSLDIGTKLKPVSYTHLDVYKRQEVVGSSL